MEHWTNECHLAYLRIRLTKRKIHMLSTVDKQDKATSSIDAEKKTTSSHDLRMCGSACKIMFFLQQNQNAILTLCYLINFVLTCCNLFLAFLTQPIKMCSGKRQSIHTPLGLLCLSNDAAILKLTS